MHTAAHSTSPLRLAELLMLLLIEECIIPDGKSTINSKNFRGKNIFPPRRAGFSGDEKQVGNRPWES